jgi:hypothetical protein
MSIIIALISTRCGVVASDGRRFSSAVPDKGIPAEVELDNFDKTFSLLEGKVIGAFAGLLEFSGRTIREHIVETASAWSDSSEDYESLVQKIKRDMQEKLFKIRDDEVGFIYRTLDMLLVAGDRVAGNNPKLFAIRFEPRNGLIIADGPETVESSPRHIGQRIRGVPEARDGAEKALSLKRNKKIDIEYLEALVRRGIKSGIFSAKSHPYGTEQACGGSIFIQRLGARD